MTDINPYLYQVRLFVNADITERKPCFYKISRMQNMEWYSTYESEQWQLNYYDTVFPESINKNIHLAGIVSHLLDENGGLLAVLEVSTKMEDLFKDFYSTDKDSYCCFIGEDGTIYSEAQKQAIWNDNREELFQYIARNTSKNEFYETSFNNQKCILSTLYLPSIKGTFVHVRNTKQTLYSYYISQVPYILVVLISMAIFIIIVVILIRNIFKRFNQLTAAVNQIKDGANIKVPEDGEDEISELGKRINSLLSSLEELNRENMNRQLFRINL